MARPGMPVAIRRRPDNAWAGRPEADDMQSGDITRHVTSAERRMPAWQGEPMSSFNASISCAAVQDGQEYSYMQC